MKKVVIIGAGISGLLIANLLRQDSNYKVVLYEKNNSINLEKSYGVQLSVNSIKLLNKIGFQKVNPQNKFNPNKVSDLDIKILFTAPSSLNLRIEKSVIFHTFNESNHLIPRASIL